MHLDVGILSIAYVYLEKMTSFLISFIYLSSIIFIQTFPCMQLLI